MNRRRQIVVAGVTAGLFPGLPTLAANRAARVAYLSLAAPDADASWRAAFRQQLQKLGYTIDKTLVLEERHANGHAARLSALADELLAARPDVMVVYGAWHIVEKLRGPIPVVFTVVPDPVAQGVVNNLARPGGNLTGFSDAHSDLIPKRLELIKEFAPQTTLVGVIYYPSLMTTMQLDAAQAAAPRKGMSIFAVAVTGPQPEDVQHAFKVMVAAGASAVLVIADQTVFANRKLIAELAITNRMVIISTVREWADAGFTMAYGADFHDLWRRAAVYVDKILKGARPGDLPVEQPTLFSLVINQRSAKALGLPIPRDLLLRADEVIE